MRSYLASTSFVDSQVGRVLDALKRNGFDKNTIVVLWSDHGWHIGEKLITGKNTLWDDGTRVPLVFAGPGIKGGQVIGKSDKDAMAPAERPVDPHDLHATVCHALGIDHTKEVQTPLGRPMRLVSEGAKPVMELFG